MDLHEPPPPEPGQDHSNPTKTLSLEPLFVYGVKPEVRGGIFFAGDNANLLYPAGCGVAVYHTKTGKQTLIPLADKGRHITALCSNKNRTLVAFSERGDRPAVVVFDLETRKRRKVLRCAEFESQEVISLSFSHDSKYLLAQGGAPDYSLVYFFWEKNKVITTLKNLSSSKNPICEVSFHPKNHSVICAVGNGFFRMCRLTEGILKQFGFQKGEHYLMTCHDWLSPRHVTLGTKTGKVLLLEEAELRATVDVHAMVQAVAAETTSHLQMSVPSLQNRSSFSTFSVCGSSASSVINEERFINAILAFKNGFVCSVGAGKVVMCEMDKPIKNVLPEEEVNFRVSTLIRLPKGNTSTCFKGNVRNVGHKVISLAMNSNETTLIALTDTLQLVSHSFKDVTSSNVPSAAVTLATMASVVTCGSDKHIRVWNYQTLEMELSKEFEEGVSSVSLHPTGLHILAGFVDKLRLMNLLIDDIRVYREFDIKDSPVCAFSRGGHLLAAVSVKNIEVYSTVNFRKRANLRGHNGRITSLRWSSSDMVLVSCGDDGSIYEWDISGSSNINKGGGKAIESKDDNEEDISSSNRNKEKRGRGRRRHEMVAKQCAYHDLALADDPEEEDEDNSLVVYAVGSDRTIKQIHRGTLLREVDLHTLTLTSLALSLDCGLLFSGSSAGRVQSFPFPLTLPGQWEEHRLHGDRVNQMRISPDNARLVTAAADGSMCIWNVRAVETVAKKFEYASEILITKSELEEKNRLVTNLQQQVDETRTESEYQLRLRDNQYAEEADARQKLHGSQVADLRQNIHKSEGALENCKRDQENTNRKLREHNQQSLIEMADMYKQKLIVEYQRFENLQEQHEQLKRGYEKKVAEMEREKKEEVEKSRAEFAKMLEEKEQESQKREEEADTRVKAVEEVLRQTEEDADKEILELRTKFERALRVERDGCVRLRGESGVMKKKWQTALKDGEEHRSSVARMAAENQRLQGAIKGLERDIGELNREVRGRDEAVGEREKRIAEAKRTCIELEKNRYVLEHKIEDLRRQIAPKDAVILDLQSQIEEMEDELTSVSKTQQELELQLQDCKAKAASSLSELSAERKKLGKQSVSLSRMQKDWADLGATKDARQLKETATRLFNKYGKGEGEKEEKEDVEEDKEETILALEETLKQKSFLERTVTSLRAQMEKREMVRKREYLRKMKENQFLVKEVEELKKELKAARGYRVPPRMAVSRSTTTEEEEEDSQQLQ